MLQIVLKSYNYYEGKIDGKIGSVSKAALRTFQNKNGLIIDGYAPNKEAVAHNFISQDGNYTDILKTQTVVVIQGPLYNDENTTLPSILTVGVGPVTVFSDGNVIEGTWRRTDITQPFTFTDSYQNPIYVPPSSQWVHIVPTDGEVTWSNS